MTSELDAHVLGWVAGILDTRGYLSDRPSSHADRRLPTVSVSMTAQPDGDPHPVIKRLCQLTGVQPVPFGKGHNRAACEEHCPEPHVHVTNTYHRWIVGGAKAITVLHAVLPCMVTKQDVARRLARMTAQYKAAHVREMQRRGWPVAWAPAG